MSLQVVFLGTAGSIPTPKRGLPAIAIRRKDEIILFDCGEGAQRQMIRAGVSFHRKTKVFITHMHARLASEKRNKWLLQKMGGNKIRERKRAHKVFCKIKDITKRS